MIKTAALGWLVSIDSRLAKERWQVDGARYTALTQQSISLTNLVNLGASYAIAQGIHYGQSDRHTADTTKKEILQGWQLDLGLIEQSRQNINLSAFISVENRKTSLNSNSNGFRGSSDSTSYLMRMAFEIQYYLNQP
jgi:hypothetical protein